MTQGNPLAHIETYPDADHGFYTRGDPGTIRVAHARTIAFLDDALNRG